MALHSLLFYAHRLLHICWCTVVAAGAQQRPQLITVVAEIVTELIRFEPEICVCYKHPVLTLYC